MNKRISFLVILVLLLNMSFVVFAETNTSSPAIEEGVNEQTPTEEAIVTPDGIEDSTNTGPAVDEPETNNGNEIRVQAITDLPDGLTITGGVEDVDWSCVPQENGTDYELYITKTGLTLSGNLNLNAQLKFIFAKDNNFEFIVSEVNAPNIALSFIYGNDVDITLSGENKFSAIYTYRTADTQKNLIIKGINNGSVTADIIGDMAFPDNTNLTFENLIIECNRFAFICRSINIKDSLIKVNNELWLEATENQGSSNSNANCNINITNSHIESCTRTEIIARGSIIINGLSGSLESLPKDNPQGPLEARSIVPLSIPDDAELKIEAIIGANINLNIKVKNDELLNVNQKNSDTDSKEYHAIYGGEGIDLGQNNSIEDAQGNPALIKVISLLSGSASASAYSVTDKDGNAINSFSIKGEITPKNDSSENEKSSSGAKSNDVNDKTNSPSTNDDSSPYLWIFMIMMSVVAISGVRKINMER